MLLSGSFSLPHWLLLDLLCCFFLFFLTAKLKCNLRCNPVAKFSNLSLFFSLTTFPLCLHPAPWLYEPCLHWSLSNLYISSPLLSEFQTYIFNCLFLYLLDCLINHNIVKKQLIQFWSHTLVLLDLSKLPFFHLHKLKAISHLWLLCLSTLLAHYLDKISLQFSCHFFFFKLRQLGYCVILCDIIYLYLLPGYCLAWNQGEG